MQIRIHVVVIIPRTRVVLSQFKDVQRKKHKYVHKFLREKCQSLKDLEKGLSNKDVAAKYGVPKNTLSGSARKRKQRKTPQAPYLGSRDIRNSCLQIVFKFAKSKRPIIWCHNPRKSKSIC